MFSPEMLKAAQGMMANMSPEDMQKMTQMAANMDPSVMDNMMKNMGGAAPGGMDSSQMKEQMQRIGQMSPDELKSSMSQAQTQMGGQKQYMYNASMQLKNEGNDHIKAQKYSEALGVYSKALENLKPFSGDDISQLRLSLLLNSAMCHLKQNDPARTVE
ncbi:OEP61, partial [Symbiodinium pilosum]